ncbi:MAG: nucleotidyltransferase domain-containing protein [Kiritimatiellae bacterium]|jgi:predicted nucleotidyltransferase|nr:nucleotidyltransferase domain-containing protein [Kiritimatiellia bacterium]
MTYAENTISLQQIKEITHHVLPFCSIVLFGSRARSDASSDSDYDFMVITKKMMDLAEKRKYKSILRKEFAKQKIPVDVLIETENDVDIKRNLSGHIVREAMRDGIVL